MKASDLDYHLPSEEFNRRYGNEEPSTEGDQMKPKYVLLVDNGTYAEDSLCKLFFNVILHRFNHFLKGEGFRD
jgi:hypothetical protein